MVKAIHIYFLHNHINKLSHITISIYKISVRNGFLKNKIFQYISPINGTASEVGGIVSATSNKNTVKDNSIVTPRKQAVT